MESRASQPQERTHVERVSRRHHSSTGHWIRTAGILAPLVIGEFVHDPDKRWRFTRIASVSVALISEGLYTHRINQERRECEAAKKR